MLSRRNACVQDYFFGLVVSLDLVPPHLAPSRVMQAVKGKTSHSLLRDRRKLRFGVLGSAPVGA
jgi:hypothetical protein